jgi:hypothetical protein
MVAIIRHCNYIIRYLQLTYIFIYLFIYFINMYYIIT